MDGFHSVLGSFLDPYQEPRSSGDAGPANLVAVTFFPKLGHRGVKPIVYQITPNLEERKNRSIGRSQ